MKKRKNVLEIVMARNVVEEIDERVGGLVYSAQ